MTALPLFIPPIPLPPVEDLPALKAFRAFRTNALHAFPAQAYEQNVISNSFAGQNRILLNDPAGIRHVLINNSDNYIRTKPTIRILRPLIGNGLFLSTGDDWRHRRRTLAPAFTPQTTTLLAPLMTRSAVAAISQLGERIDQPFDLLASMQNLALDIAGSTMFSLEMNRFGQSMRDLIQLYAEKLGRPYILDFLLPLSVSSPMDIQRALFRRRWRRLIDHMIADRAALPASEQHRDLFDLLISARDPETGRGFSSRRLADEVATMIVAGHETTALVLFWSLYLLSEAPDIQEKVAAEVAPLSLAPSDVTMLLGSMPYTRAVIQEALRLYPPAYAILRQALKSDIVGTIAIPKGGVIIISPWVLHRHKRLWSAPDSFDPCRFLDKAAPPDRFAYLPFGIGPRVCIGAQFALTEATLVLATFIQKFTIRRLTAKPVLPNPIVTCQPDHAPLFSLARR